MKNKEDLPEVDHELIDLRIQDLCIRKAELVTRKNDYYTMLHIADRLHTSVWQELKEIEREINKVKTW